MEVKTFNQEMIDRFLKSNKITSVFAEAGGITFNLAQDTKLGCDLQVWMVVSGEIDEVYDIRIYSSRKIPTEDWTSAIAACNEWNDSKRWPKVYLHIAEEDGDSNGYVTCEGDIDLEAGIHQELFDSFTLTTITRAQEFWEWMHMEKGF